MPLIKSQCDYCGKIIYKWHHILKKTKNHFCSRSCNAKYRFKNSKRHQKRNCNNCNKEILYLANYREETEKYFCDIKCHHEFMKKNSIFLKRICKNCNKEFSFPLYYVNGTGGKEKKFCNYKCYYEFCKKKLIKIKCHICKKSKFILKYKYLRDKHHFCSEKCYRYFRRNLKFIKNLSTYRKEYRDFKASLKIKKKHQINLKVLPEDLLKTMYIIWKKNQIMERETKYHANEYVRGNFKPIIKRHYKTNL